MLTRYLETFVKILDIIISKKVKSVKVIEKVKKFVNKNKILPKFLSN